MKLLIIFLLIALFPVTTTTTFSCPSIIQDPSSPPAHQTQPEQPRNALPLLPVTNPQAAGEPNPPPLALIPATNPRAAREPNSGNPITPVPPPNPSPVALFPVTVYQSSDHHPNPNLPTLSPATYHHQSPDFPNPNPRFLSTLFQLPVAIEAAAPHGPLPFEFEVMDNLRLSVLSYFFANGLSYTSSWCQCRNFSTSIQIQCFLNQLAFSLFLLAKIVFPPTHPALALMLHRLSVLLMIISGYLASMPMLPPYIALIMFVVVVLIYIINRLTRD